MEVRQCSEGFLKKSGLFQQAQKDLVTGLGELTFLSKSKWAAWGHHLWKFPLALIQETQLSQPVLQYQRASSPRRENDGVWTAATQMPAAASSPALLLTSHEGGFITVGHRHCSPLQTGGYKAPVGPTQLSPQWLVLWSPRSSEPKADWGLVNSHTALWKVGTASITLTVWLDTESPEVKVILLRGRTKIALC